MIKIPISLGELFDKITILNIKLEKISGESKIKNINKELILLQAIAKKNPIDPNLLVDLDSVNRRIWDIEDNIRLCEKDKNFGQYFIGLARGVYFNNDTRSDIKRQINESHDSDIIEEKSYEKY